MSTIYYQELLIQVIQQSMRHVAMVTIRSSYAKRLVKKGTSTVLMSKMRQSQIRKSVCETKSLQMRLLSKTATAISNTMFRLTGSHALAEPYSISAGCQVVTTPLLQKRTRLSLRSKDYLSTSRQEVWSFSLFTMGIPGVKRKNTT